MTEDGKTVPADKAAAGKDNAAGYHTPSAIQTPEEAWYSNLMRKVREQGY